MNRLTDNQHPSKNAEEARHDNVNAVSEAQANAAESQTSKTQKHKDWIILAVTFPLFLLFVYFLYRMIAGLLYAG